MLSILIPVYNNNCCELVRTLQKQCCAAGIDFEIIIAEDGSTHVYSYPEEKNIRHIIRKENVGRAAIRNFLFDEAKYETMLIMDCDVSIRNPQFISTYLRYAEGHEVVCGGLSYSTPHRNATNKLRYEYEKNYERHNSARHLNGMERPPFRSTCFMIHQSVTEKVQFDEQYTGYGYEDVKFGKDLRDAGITVYYIDNPVTVESDESDDEFRAKTLEAIITLCRHRDDLREDSQLLRTAEYLKRHSLLRNCLGIAEKLCFCQTCRFQMWKLKKCIENL